MTGASTGIGFEAALQLRDAGFLVYAGARRVAKMQPLAARGITVLSLDVTEEASMQAVVDAVVRPHGQVDVLVNNAGYGSYGSLEEVRLEEVRRQLDVNIFGLARMTQLVLPGMRAAGSGRIINISSIGGNGPYAEQARGHARILGAQDGPFLLEASVIAKDIVHAATVARPKTRYPSGSGAAAILALRRLLPDRAFDFALSGRSSPGWPGRRSGHQPRPLKQQLAPIVFEKHGRQLRPQRVRGAAQRT